MRSRLQFVGFLRSIVPMKIRVHVQGSPILSKAYRKLVLLLIRTGGRIQTINDGLASGIRLYVGEHITEIYISGKYEPEVQGVLAKHLKIGDVVYDIGASIGFFTLLSAKLVGENGTVYSFEPAFHAYKSLLRNIGVNKFYWIVPFQECLTDGPREVTFAVTGNAYGSSIVTGDEMKWQISRVLATSIDGIISTRSLKPPDLIKIDVEGEEGNVLLGSKNTLQEYKPIIICEIHSSKSATEVYAVLEQQGYTCSILGSPNWDWHMFERMKDGDERRILATHHDRERRGSV